MSGGTRRLVAFLAVAFVLRLAFGLAFDFWGDDEFQIYLIGLKFYTTGAWPLYGPDVVYTETRLPGGMQGLLVGGPFWIAPWPEAPYVLLNVLSLGALALLAWYIGRRLPDIPRWFLWTWVFFSPWTLDISAHIINTSYAILGAIVFFVSAFELVPGLRVGAVPRALAFVGLGFGLLWVAQFHLSAAILVPIALVVLVLAGRDDPRQASSRSRLVRPRCRARGSDDRADAPPGRPRRRCRADGRERRFRADEPASIAADRRAVPVAGDVRGRPVHGPEHA